MVKEKEIQLLEIIKWLIAAIFIALQQHIEQTEILKDMRELLKKAAENASN